jgi:hypothetical protein
MARRGCWPRWKRERGPSTGGASARRAGGMAVVGLTVLGLAACDGPERGTWAVEEAPVVVGGAGGAGLGGAGGRGAAGAGLAAGGDGTGGTAAHSPSCEPGVPAYAVEVMSVSYGPGAGFGQDAMPDVVLGPPVGAGCCAGSLDVLSLGNGGEIVLGFGGAIIVDGPGADFIVFENPFQIGGDPTVVFAEIATVAASADGVSWHEFPCMALGAPWGSCAGWHPVYQNGDSAELDPATAGGDPFDLAEVGLSEARYVRITDRPDLGGPAGIFDLDAVGIVSPSCL